MFGRRNKHAEALDELREEFSAADRHARAALADAMAQIELRTARERDERETARLAMETALEEAQSSLNAQAMDVGRLLQQVANTCALVAERVDADRAERRMFVEAIARLTQSPELPAESAERPLGGTVFPEIATPPEPRVDETDAGRVATEPPAAAEAVAPAAEEEIIDLREPEDSPRPSRTLPRWVTKRS
jgi:hypothetical protein